MRRKNFLCCQTNVPQGNQVVAQRFSGTKENVTNEQIEAVNMSVDAVPQRVKSFQNRIQLHLKS
jgi:hypothetical protein